jgi:hypothetical protein
MEKNGETIHVVGKNEKKKKKKKGKKKNLEKKSKCNQN